jgi:hypothetical protein
VDVTQGTCNRVAIDLSDESAQRKAQNTSEDLLGVVLDNMIAGVTVLKVDDEAHDGIPLRRGVGGKLSCVQSV